MIIFASKSITGVQWENGQPAMWQQVGAWPQGTSLLSPTALMPQPVGQVWPQPVGGSDGRSAEVDFNITPSLSYFKTILGGRLQVQ